MPEGAGLLLATALGLAIGSFLNVCIYRLPRRLSVVSPPSRCGACGHQLAWFENVPLVSYAVLRGRCRSCRASISVQYPIVELVTAVAFAGLYWLYGPTPLFGVRALFACVLIVLFVIDLQHKILPNAVTLPFTVIGFISSLIVGPGAVDSLIGIVVGGGVLFVIAESYFRIRGEEGLGMGDVKMLAMVGAFLGWKLALVTLVLSSLVGSAIGLGIIAIRKESMKYALPFGTFLAIAAFVSAVAGDAILAWYFGLYPPS